MLPKIYHQDDEKWILSQMRRIPIELCEKAAIGYAKAWDDMLNSNLPEVLREGEARREANTRLRIYANTVGVRW